MGGKVLTQLMSKSDECVIFSCWTNVSQLFVLIERLGRVDILRIVEGHSPRRDVLFVRDCSDTLRLVLYAAANVSHPFLFVVQHLIASAYVRQLKNSGSPSPSPSPSADGTPCDFFVNVVIIYCKHGFVIRDGVFALSYPVEDFGDGLDQDTDMYIAVVIDDSSLGLRRPIDIFQCSKQEICDLVLDAAKIQSLKVAPLV